MQLNFYRTFFRYSEVYDNSQYVSAPYIVHSSNNKGSRFVLKIGSALNIDLNDNKICKKEEKEQVKCNFPVIL